MDLGEVWQHGCNAWGVRGLFPTSCVEELNLSGRSRQLSERSALAQASELPPYALGQARALMSLHAQLNEELDFREGDLVIITGLPEPGWFQGELEGRRGIFPEGFVELVAPLRSPQVPLDCQYLNNDPQQLICKDTDDAGEGTEDESVEEGEVFHGEEEEQNEVIEEEHEEEHIDEDGIYGVALYEFRAMEPGELDFDVGDRIRIVNTLEDGWLDGELRGRHGIFPHRFVKIEDNGQEISGEIHVESENVTENGCIEQSSNREHPDESEKNPEWRTYEDHTVWDLDYFERTEEQRWQCEHNSVKDQTVKREQSKEGNRPESQPPRHTPPSYSQPERRKSTPPARPSFPPRLSLPAHYHKQQVGQKSSGNQSNYTNGNVQPVQPRRTQSLLLRSSQSGWSKEKTCPQRPLTDCTSTNRRSPSLSQALNTIVEGHKQQRLTRHSSMSDVEARPRPQRRTRGTNGTLPASITLEALAASASDLEAKLSQQLFEFEKSLSSYSDTNMSCGASTPADLNQQSHISRHFSILKYNNEDDIISGSTHSSVPSFKSSSLERRRSLRPPPPRPRVLRPPAPAAYRPARPAPRPPPRCPRQNASCPSSSPLAKVHTDDEPATTVPNEGQVEFDDPTPTQEHEIQDQLDAEQELDREMELESERQKEEEENYQLLLRLQEVEHEMEEYARTAEELGAMLEEEEDEAARLQALENLEFCSYTLETLALEQQHLQGKTEQ